MIIEWSLFEHSIKPQFSHLLSSSPQKKVGILFVKLRENLFNWISDSIFFQDAMSKYKKSSLFLITQKFSAFAGGLNSNMLNIFFNLFSDILAQKYLKKSKLSFFFIIIFSKSQTNLEFSNHLNQIHHHRNHRIAWLENRLCTVAFRQCHRNLLRIASLLAIYQ